MIARLFLIAGTAFAVALIDIVALSMVAHQAEMVSQ